VADVTLDDCELTEEMIAAAKAELVDTDGEPLESPWHRAAINLLIEVVIWLLRGRTDYFVGGNMFVYFCKDQVRKRQYRGPDFFFVKGVDGTRERRFWWVFEEDGKFPDAIIELLSPTTAKEDRTTKKALYEQDFRTPEYFCYDPDTAQLEGWRLLTASYQPITANDRGRLWSEELGVWIGLWEGTYQGRRTTWVRFFDLDGQLLLTETEAVNQRAETEHQRAETERQRAETEHQRAETERQRAEALQVELARLQALLADKGKQPSTNG
jgi:Uma2 family endonuclease